MKKILTLGAAAVLILSACSKNNDSGSGSTTNSYTINNKTYRANNIYAYDGVVYASDTNTLTGISFGFYKRVLPMVNKTYKVVEVPSSADEVSIVIADDSGFNCRSGNNGGSVYAYIVNRKINLVLPKNVVGSGGSLFDVSANVTQQ